MLANGYQICCFTLNYGLIALQIFAIHHFFSCSSTKKLWSEHILSDSFEFKTFLLQFEEGPFPVLTWQCTSLMFLWLKEEISAVRYIIMLKNWCSTPLCLKRSSVHTLQAIKWRKKWFHLWYFTTLQQQKTLLDQSVLLSGTFAI